MATRVQLAIMEGLSRLGDLYEWGAKPLLTGRRSTDCSGFGQIMVAKAGIERIEKDGKSIGIRSWAGSVVQYNWCRDIPVAAALGKGGIGTFLFIAPRGNKAGHVAFSLGNGYTLEARGSEGVCICGPDVNGHAAGSRVVPGKRTWDRAGKLDQLFEEAA